MEDAESVRAVYSATATAIDCTGELVKDQFLTRRIATGCHKMSSVDHPHV